MGEIRRNTSLLVVSKEAPKCPRFYNIDRKTNSCYYHGKQSPIRENTYERWTIVDMWKVLFASPSPQSFLYWWIWPRFLCCHWISDTPRRCRWLCVSLCMTSYCHLWLQCGWGISAAASGSLGLFSTLKTSSLLGFTLRDALGFPALLTT